MARLLIVDDDPKIRLFLTDLLGNWDHDCTEADTADKAKILASREDFDVIFLDLDLPDDNGLNILPNLINAPSRPEIIIITGTGDIGGAKLAFKYGAWDYIEKPFTLDEVSLPISRALDYRREKKGPVQPVALDRQKIIGESGAIRSCLDEVARAASTNANVLITGETGTGKELFARAIHLNSKRVKEPFIALDCGAIPESLVEETFFGHEKGAFTGADTKRDGVLKQADGGTLFLDEVGDLALQSQKSLLRALQEKVVRPIGGREVPVDFRLVAATNRDLVKMVQEEKFREDLLFRIKGIEIHLPPLRLRDDDIRDIVLHKIPQICSANGTEVKGFSPQFLDLLVAQQWSGNVRELINVLEFSCAAAGHDPTLHPKHLPPEYRTAFLAKEQGEAPIRKLEQAALPASADEDFPTLQLHRELAEKKYFETLVRRTRGDREKACQIADVSQARLYRLLKKYGLSLYRQF